jgi:hypothetical protein
MPKSLLQIYVVPAQAGTTVVHGAALQRHDVDYCFGYLIVISFSRLSAWSTSFITHSM